MIGIIGAMDVEVAILRERMTGAVTERVSGIDFIRGTLCGRDVVLARSGVGKVFAALCAQTMILRYGVDTLVNSGVAGTLTDALHIGDVAISQDCVQYDMDTSAVGDPVGLISGINLVNLPTEKTLAAQFAEICSAQGVNHRVGLIATGDQFVASHERRTWIAETFGAIAVEMESGAIAQTAYVNGCRFVSLRVVSDEAGGEATVDYPVFVKKAAATSSELTLAWLAAYGNA